MGDEQEISLKVLSAAIDRYLFRERDGRPTVQWGGEEMVLMPVSHATALVLAGSAMVTLAALLPAAVEKLSVKLSE